MAERKNHTENHVDKKSLSEKKLLASFAPDMAQDMLGFRSASAGGQSTKGAGGGASLLDGRGEAGSGQPALSYNLGHVGAGSNAIALAAAQAVSTTLQVS